MRSINDLLDDLFASICCCSCGACCSKPTLCDNCVISTLKGNGLKLSLKDEITGLLQRSRNHGNGFQYSELYEKLQALTSNPGNYATSYD